MPGWMKSRCSAPPGLALVVSKLLALLGAVALLQLVAMATAIAVQLGHGYHRLQLGLYLGTLFGTAFSTFLFFAVLAFFIHIIPPTSTSAISPMLPSPC